MTAPRFPAFSVRQPFADWILAGVKDVENKKTRTRMRGTILVHASASRPNADEVARVTKLLRDTKQIGHRDEYEPRLGAILGMVDIVDSVIESDSDWFSGPHGWVLARPREFKEPILYKGAVGIFYVPTSLLGGTPAAKARPAISMAG